MASPAAGATAKAAAPAAEATCCRRALSQPSTAPMPKLAAIQLMAPTSCGSAVASSTSGKPGAEAAAVRCWMDAAAPVPGITYAAAGTPKHSKDARAREERAIAKWGL
eukprot:CAMPEP_0115303218 /NCGR_PEP_ID=MMETSP0270-20121206/70801_1 /TAXON_ID=71861 /ORGANISM="Scrippsiella trochoidea, Strain CCMP3099" /LENGTH=107 /DNA_ID=CAMNT_0002721201 /DNA_START=49 /DNA_END=368 /DNA_ORIENTATION=-